MLELIGATILSILAVILATLGIGTISENKRKTELSHSDTSESEPSSQVHEFYGKIKQGIQKNMFDKFVEENDLFDDRRINRLDNLTHKVNSEFNREKLNSVSEEWVKKNMPVHYKLNKFLPGYGPDHTYIENSFYHAGKDYYERDWLSGRKLREGKLEDILQYGLLSLNKYVKTTGKDAPNAECDDSDHVWLTAEINTALRYTHSNSKYVGNEPGLTVVLDKSVSEKFDKKHVQVSSYAAVVRDEIPWNYVKAVLIPEEDYSEAMYILKVKHPEWNKETFGGKQLSDIFTPIKGNDIDRYEMNAKKELSKMYAK